jgi:hypothetical protein
MSFLDYLKDHRGQFVDHRHASAPTNPGPSALEIELLDLPDTDAAASGTAAPSRRRRRSRTTPGSIRFRQVRPTYAPLPYSDPLPYDEPWERAFR